eukprot:TRINITY_DN21963_c0_g1_i2.p1 TRINITY_DN21963_c0_g1~~TRINITY_DN21963_c0_g1_i2.p1  ORF type:complete len:251 (+),score=15.15 TRINITY_DN21963_c0_g1_i2:96-755(+)
MHQPSAHYILLVLALCVVQLHAEELIGSWEHLKALDPYENWEYMRDVLSGTVKEKHFGRHEFVLPQGKKRGLPGRQEPCHPSSFLTPQDKSGLTGRWLQEIHHLSFNPPWIHGRDVTNFLKSEGLQPHHRLFEYGCGALRNGVHLIRFLDEGHYTGVSFDTELYNIGTQYELSVNGINHKKPDIHESADTSKLWTKQGTEKYDFILLSVFLQHLNAVCA